VLASAPQESGARVRVVRLRVLMVAMVKRQGKDFSSTEVDCH